jgi:hypothetical protein
MKRCTVMNQLNGYDILTCHAVLCIVVGKMSLHIMHVSNYNVVDIMTVSNANLYLVLARSSSVFFFFLHGGVWSPNWVHSARQPLTGLLYLPRVIVRMENLVE